MTTLKLKAKQLAMMFALLLGLTSCSDDSDNTNMLPSGTLSINAGATYSGTSSRNAVEVSRFLLNLEEIELEFDDDNYDDDDDNDDYGDYDDDGFINGDDEIELEGPFEIDVLSTTNLVTLSVPQAEYEELEFEFDDNENPNSDLFGKTVLIEGTINGTPFEFWYDFEAEVEIDYEDSNQDIDVNAGLNSIIINFDLDNILNQVDLSQATDGDNDGLIEINPNDDDGNEDLADALKDALENNIELLDELDD